MRRHACIVQRLHDTVRGQLATAASTAGGRAACAAAGCSGKVQHQRGAQRWRKSKRRARIARAGWCCRGS
eukprot:1750536-Lingulodinium_polyedra.AAC.1